MKKICITGANGFIGQSLCKHLSGLNYFVVAIVRDKKFFLNLKNVKYYKVKNFNDKKQWKKLLKNCDYIVHCAGKSNLPEKLKNYEKYNSENFIDIKNIIKVNMFFNLTPFVLQVIKNLYKECSRTTSRVKNFN